MAIDYLDYPRTHGRRRSEGLSLADLFGRFPDEETARVWMEQVRWRGEPHCPYCGSRRVGACTSDRSLNWRCQADGCRRRFNVRIGTALERTRLGYRTWAVAVHLVVEHSKGVSSVRLARHLGITQKSAWFLAHRIRRAFESAPGGTTLRGPGRGRRGVFRRLGEEQARRQEVARGPRRRRQDPPWSRYSTGPPTRTGRRSTHNYSSRPPAERPGGSAIGT